MRDVSQGEQALQRLLVRATQADVTGRYVANFLLAWWNAPTCGGFDPKDMWLIDEATCGDMIVVLSWIATTRSCPEQLGYGDQFREVVQVHKRRARRTYPGYSFAGI